MVINEDQAEIIKLIFREYLKGNGCTKICRELEKRGYKTSTGLTRWQPPYIMQVLKNPFYCGTIVYRKSFVPDFLEQKRKNNRGEVDKTIVKVKHTSIISEEDFIEVQKIIAEKNKLTKNNTITGMETASNLWTKKLECNCDSSFSRRKNNVLQDGTKTYHFKCNNQKSSCGSGKKYKQCYGK